MDNIQKIIDDLKIILQAGFQHRKKMPKVSKPRERLRDTRKISAYSG